MHLQHDSWRMTHQWTRILDGIHHTKFQDSYFYDANMDGDSIKFRC